MTHAELVTVACRWLRRAQRCGVVLAEHHGGTLEHPDAIGWRGWYSMQVECKVSKSDFRADAKKNGRSAGSSQAVERWYLTPVGMLALVDLPAKWGLLEWNGRQVRVIRKAERIEQTDDVWRHSVIRMYCELRRYQSQGLKYLTVEKLNERERDERITARAMRLLAVPVSADGAPGGEQ